MLERNLVRNSIQSMNLHPKEKISKGYRVAQCADVANKFKNKIFIYGLFSTTSITINHLYKISNNLK